MMNWGTSNIERRTLNVEGICPGALGVVIPALAGNLEHRTSNIEHPTSNGLFAFSGFRANFRLISGPRISRNNSPIELWYQSENMETGRMPVLRIMARVKLWNAFGRPRVIISIQRRSL